jgi:hypothetical protein
MYEAYVVSPTRAGRMRGNPSQLVSLFTAVQNLYIFQHPACVSSTANSPETNIRICVVENFSNALKF